MKYPHILARILTTRWAIMPSGFDGITRALNGEAPVIPDVEEAAEAPVSYGGNIAVISVCGIIGKHLSAMETMCGGCSIEDIQDEYEAAIADQNVTDIVVCFDSPGGTVPGVPELATRMRAKANLSGKSVYAFTDTLMASAAYWLASSCDYIACTPTATVGSIGVYCAFSDYSEAYKKEGIKINLIKAGKFKDMGSEHRPMTDEEQAMIQAEIDDIHAIFKADVKTGRPNVKDAALEGQTFMGQKAVEAGLVDEIVPDFQAFIEGLQGIRASI